ncbi:MAG: hypothetical protein CMO80_16700 [Verrucomicrobiales bacterium]|nr:hypothetical protein [Verrucomicrobiales bacterium]|tara:strand:+ start:1435 stop:2565 length:1131 start_codon:yes stop_codon:yes gene_type:complete
MKSDIEMNLKRLGMNVGSALMITICPFGLPAAESTGANEELISLPVRVFRLKSDASEKINCTLDNPALSKLFAVANESWEPAKIEWTIESVRNIRASDELAREFDAVPGGKDGMRKGVQILSRIYSADGFLEPGFNLVIVESMGPGAGGLFRAVPDGEIIYGNISPRGKSVPAILAHEFGHSLSLPHTIFETNNNLMMGAGPGRKPTRTKPLTESQITLARTQAAKGVPFRPTRLNAPAAPDKLFEYLDRDEDGTITVEEAETKQQPYVRNLLRLASRAPGDSLTKNEFDLFQLRNKRKQPPSNQGRRVAPPVSQIFSRADKNDDGKLSAKEAKGHVPSRNFKMADRNEDGFVTQDEMIATRKRFGISAEGFRSGR